MREIKVKDHIIHFQGLSMHIGMKMFKNTYINIFKKLNTELVSSKVVM